MLFSGRVIAYASGLQFIFNSKSGKQQEKQSLMSIREMTVSHELRKAVLSIHYDLLNYCNLRCLIENFEEYILLCVNASEFSEAILLT